MDQELKQRLVGAVVITALAAIFVPMLFDDPVDDTRQQINELKIPDLPSELKTIQLSGAPKSSEEVINLPSPNSSESTSENDNHPSKLNRWFLQAGIFSQQSNALVLQKKLRGQGFTATITKVSSDTGVLYKVKVGPEMSQERAEAVKTKLKNLYDINSFIILD